MTKRSYKITVIPGDGIGPEVVKIALEVASVLPLDFEYSFQEAGFSAYEKYGTSLPESTIESIASSEAVFFGAVTTPPNIPGYKSPIVQLRKIFDLFANVRPIKGIFKEDIDFVVIRENTEGLYVGQEREFKDGVVSERVITKKGSERIIRFAFEFCRKNKRRKLTLVHKANVIRLADGMFLQTGQRIAKEYPEIEFEDQLVDSCAYQIVKKPQNFDVIVTTNMFGDILSDLAAGVVEGLGVLPSGNIGEKLALFEPVHGSAPKYAGKDKANPTAAILAFAMLLEFLGENNYAQVLRDSVFEVIRSGSSTYDLGGSLSSSAFGRRVRNELKTRI